MLVVGNGPSLNKTPLDEFQDVPSIGMNKINLLFERTSWRPSMIVCVNNLVVKQNRDFFVKTEIPTFLAWKCRWYVKSKDTRNLHYFKVVPRIDFSEDVSSSVAGCGSTVTYSALQFAYFTGANPIILFGVDHSFKVPEGKMAIVKSQEADANHFDPNYFGKGQHWGLPDLEGSEYAYGLAKKQFEEDGREVLDATIGGKLEVFRKISVSEAKSICGV